MNAFKVIEILAYTLLTSVLGLLFIGFITYAVFWIAS